MTDRWLTFHPVLSPPLAMVLLLALALVMTWLEWKRTMAFRSLRMLAVGAIIVAVSGLLFRPAYKTKKFETCALLTTGYDRTKVDSLQRTYSGIIFLNAPGVTPYKNSTSLNSWHELSTSYPAIDFVVGQGLPLAALDLIPEKSFQFIPAPPPKGITRVVANEPVFAGRKNYVEGTIETDEASTILYLDGPGGKEDSVRIAKNGKQKFKLQFYPKNAGNFLYNLRSDKGLNEVLPIRVQDRPAMEILFIQNYPTFESGYLKNFLARQHHILFRYQPSRNIFRYEYLNRKPQAIASLNAESLSLFDLLVIDTDAWQSLSKKERVAVRQGIRSGLGIIILFNESPAGIKNLRDFLPLKFSKIAFDTAQFKAGSSKTITLPAWAVEPRSSNPIIPTLKNKNRILSGYQSVGFGKTAFQLLQETYALALQGDSIAYGTIWSALLEQTARATKRKFSLRLTTPWPLFPNQPITIEVLSSGEEPELFQKGNRIPLQEDVLIDDIWKGKIWADHPGWHSINLKNDSSKLDYFVAEENTWPSLSSANAIKETSMRAATTGFQNRPKTSDQTVALWIFYILFVTGATILWLTPKL